MKFSNKYQFIILPAIALLTLLSGCVKDELKELEEKEKKIIAQYIAANPGFVQTVGGLYVKEEVVGTGKTPVNGNYVFINYVGRYLEGGVIRETNYDSLKGDWPLAVKLENFLYGPSKITYGDKMPGINEALGMMKEGGKAKFIIPSEKANYDYRPLLYELELIWVVRKPDIYEDSVRNAYIQKHFDAEARIDTFDIWYKLSDTTDSTIEFDARDTMYFNFTARLVDGFGDSIQVDRIYDSNKDKDPVKYVYGKPTLAFGEMLIQNTLPRNTLPKGLKTAFDSLQIRNLSKASILLGYNMAFDKTGYLHPVDKYIIIPAYQTVMYDIEVTAIRSVE